MRKTNLTSAALAVAIIGCGGGHTSNASTFSNALKSSSRAKPVREFRGEKPWYVTASSANGNLAPGSMRKSAPKDPEVAFDGLNNFDYLEAPDGSTWFYVSEYEVEEIEVSEWYSETLIKAYTFTIYDSSFNMVGQIKDKITLAKGETKVAHAVLDPSVSRNFFNSDSNPEVMVYLAMNTGEAQDYQVNYYNKIYSVGGEKDADGNDVCLGTMKGRCVDTFNAGDTGKENFFYTFVEDVYPDPSDYTFDQFVDYLNAAKTVVSVYNRAAGKDAPEEIYTKDIYLTRYPADTTDGIYLITKPYQGTPYFFFSYYAKPYFIDPTGFASDENATPDNFLIIEAYKYEDGMKPITTTRIPVVIAEVEGQVAYSFYSIGSVAWKNDIDMSVNGSPAAPAYLVCIDNTTAANLDDVGSTFRMYGNDGKALHTVAENADGISLMHSAPGHEPHALIISVDDDEAYTFDFIDIFSGKRLFTLDQDNEGDPLTALCQRVLGEDGKYKYAFEMTYDITDSEGNDVKRIAWYGQDGSFIRIDRLNMLQDVMYATVNLGADSLNPYLYDDDDAMEYAVLVKRAVGNTTRNEFMVIDDSGSQYAIFSEDDGRGAPYTFTILTGAEGNSLQMVYIDDTAYNIDIYSLPFNELSGVDSIISDYDPGSFNSVSFDGAAVSAPGCRVAVYDLNGAGIAQGNGKVSLDSIPQGIYMAVATDTSGNRQTMKIIK